MDPDTFKECVMPTINLILLVILFASIGYNWRNSR